MNNPRHENEAPLLPEESLEAMLPLLPLAPLPPDFMEQLMSQVARYPRSYRPAPFKLQFLDFALPAFIAVFGLVTFVLMTWLGGQLLVDGVSAEQLAQTLLTQQWLFWGVLLLVGELITAVCFGVVLSERDFFNEFQQNRVSW